MFSYKVKSKQQTNQQTSKPGNTKELQWQQKEQWQQERGFWLARSHHTMKYIRETGETHSKLLYHAWSRWSVGRSRYTMPCPDGPREEAIHNAWSRWSVGSPFVMVVMVSCVGTQVQCIGSRLHTHNHYDRHIQALFFPISCRSYTRVNTHSDALVCNRVVKVMYMLCSSNMCEWVKSICIWWMLFHTHKHTHTHARTHTHTHTHTHTQTYTHTHKHMYDAKKCEWVSEIALLWKDACYLSKRPTIVMDGCAVEIIIFYPLTTRIVGVPQTISQPVSSIFPCSPPPSSYLFFCLPCRLPPFTVPCKMVLARPDERETCTHLFFFFKT